MRFNFKIKYLLTQVLVTYRYSPSDDEGHDKRFGKG